MRIILPTRVSQKCKKIVSMCKSETRKKTKQKKAKKKKERRQKEISRSKVARLGSNEIFRGDRNVITIRGKEEDRNGEEGEKWVERHETKPEQKEKKRDTNYKVCNQPIDNIHLKDDKKLAVMMTL